MLGLVQTVLREELCIVWVQDALELRAARGHPFMDVSLGGHVGAFGGGGV